jgi:hypothetical protein
MRSSTKRGKLEKGESSTNIEGFESANKGDYKAKAAAPVAAAAVAAREIEEEENVNEN